MSEGKVTRTVQQGEEEKYYMYYAIKENAYEGMQGLGKGNVASLKDVFLIDDKLNVRYIANNGKEYGDNLENKVLEDETEIRFSSKAFSEYVSKISGVKEDELKFKWMKNQTKLTIADPNINSLQDLVFFPNLTYLQLSGDSQITTLDGVEKCNKLQTIYISGGPDKDYTALKMLNNLTIFERAAGNDFDNIIDALKFCKTLNRLVIRLQNISSIKRISELENIKELGIIYSGITKIEGLESLNSLTKLNVSDNKITKLDGLNGLSNLTDLDLSNNQITDITPLAVNTNLQVLNLKGNVGIDGNRNNYTGKKLEALNKIGEILDRKGNIYLDVDKLGLFTNYTRLELADQYLTTLEPLEGLTELTYLDLYRNKLTLEDEKSQEILKNMTQLNTLNLSYNKVTNAVAINSLENLEYLYINGIENNINLKEIEDIISNLRYFSVSDNNLKTIINCDINKITTLNLKDGNLTEIPDLSKFIKLTKLSLDRIPSIVNFDMVSKITSLENLNLPENNLHGRMIDFSKLTNLTNLNLSNNTLWDEDLENLKALKDKENLTIDLRNNSIINATALLELNPNTKINLSGNVNLTQEAKEELERHFQDRVKF